MTGGGTLGHILPGLAIYAFLPKETEVFWIGRKNVEEQKLIEKSNIRFYKVSSGKYRRYFSLLNFIDFFKIINSYFQCKRILKKEKPDVIFSKGGFVAVPVAWAASSLKIPIITHESDTTVGLATKLIAKKANLICTGFDVTAACLASTNQALIVTGNPVRTQLLHGDGATWKAKNNIPNEQKVVLVIGGSQGALKINEAIRTGFPSICEKCFLVLQTGKGKLDPDYKCKNYKEVEFFDEDFADVLAAADIVVSRGGAGAIAELTALKKPLILVPLGLNASRGDQIVNANKLMEANAAIVIDDYSLIVENIRALLDNSAIKDMLIQAISKQEIKDAGKTIANLILKVGRNELFNC